LGFFGACEAVRAGAGFRGVPRSRTYDALHLASAKVAGELEFITADVRQRAAALLMGFTVLP